MAFQDVPVFMSGRLFTPTWGMVLWSPSINNGSFNSLSLKLVGNPARISGFAIKKVFLDVFFGLKSSSHLPILDQQIFAFFMGKDPNFLGCGNFFSYNKRRHVLQQKPPNTCNFRHLMCWGCRELQTAPGQDVRVRKWGGPCNPVAFHHRKHSWLFVRYCAVFLLRFGLESY